MNYTHKEPLQPKLTAMPASKDVEALVRAEHHDPFSILGPHDDEQGGQFIRAFLPEALSVQVLAQDSGEPIGSLDATQVRSFVLPVSLTTSTELSRSCRQLETRTWSESEP